MTRQHMTRLLTAIRNGEPSHFLRYLAPQLTGWSGQDWYATIEDDDDGITVRLHHWRRTSTGYKDRPHFRTYTA